MDWMIPEKLKKRVSYARFFATLWIRWRFVKHEIVKLVLFKRGIRADSLSKRCFGDVSTQQ
jgi:hypothetical protein